MKADILNWNKETTGQVELSPELFGCEVKPALLAAVVRWQRAGRRAGTHKAKTRGEVSGGGKKPFRQKGTGNARQGSIRSPLNEGGGVVFGPRPKSWAYALPSRVRKAGLWQALSFLRANNKMFIVENLRSPKGKTKELSQRLKKLGLSKALLVDKNVDPLFQRACRNLKSFQTLKAEALNVYDLLKYNCLVISQEGITFLSSRPSGRPKPPNFKSKPLAVKPNLLDEQKPPAEKTAKASAELRNSL